MVSRSSAILNLWPMPRNSVTCTKIELRLANGLFCSELSKLRTIPDCWNSDLKTLFSQVSLHNTTRCHFTERRGGRVIFLLRLVCEHLINVNNRCYDRCYGKSRILLIRFLKSRCFNAGNRLRLFQDSIPKCLKVTILPFKKKWLLQPNITFFEYKTTLNAKLRETRLHSKPVIPTWCHSCPQSRLALLAAGDWARGPRGSGDTGFDWLSRNNKI